MSHLTKVAGTWRNSKPYTKVAGTWKLADYVYNKVGGRWYTSFVKGGLVDKSWDDRDQTGQFGVGPGANAVVYSIAVQTDGKILVGGEFTTWNGTTVGRIVRLNADGTRDTAFTTANGTGANSTVKTLTIQSDGKILVGGGFATWNGTTVGRIVRLNSDGTLDTAFTTNNGTGTGIGSVEKIAVQTDGKILVGGGFTTWNGTTVGYIVRLDSTGARDTAFTTANGTGAGGNPVYSIAVQTDGKILVGGQFLTWNGTTVGRIVRLSSAGALDTAFTTANGTGASPVVNAHVYSIAVQSDGKILVGGTFTTWNGTTVGYIVRLSSAGALDTAFTTANGTGASSGVYSIAIQIDGKTILTGRFSSWNAVTVGRIVRLNSDGTRDTAFTTNVGTGATGGSNGINFSLAVQTDGKILVGGDFTSWGGAAVIVRLNADGTSPGVLSTFANLTITTIAIQSDNKIVIGGSVTSWNSTTVGHLVRLNADATLDTAFTTNNGTGGSGGNPTTVAIQSDGKILVGGSDTTWNGAAFSYILRLNADGTRDTAFTTNIGTGPNSFIRWITIQSDGKILVAGDFTTWNGTTVGRIVRLDSTGALDTAFTTANGTGGNAIAYSIAVQSDGKILVGSSFTSWNGTTVGRIVRLSSAGALDTAFTTANGTGAGTSIVYSVAVQTDGKILVGGDFTTWNAVTVGRIVRLSSAGALDTAFTTANGTGANGLIRGVTLQSDGKILVGGDFTSWNAVTVGRIVRLNSDGTRDTAFTTNAGTGANALIRAITLQSDKKLLIGGTFTSFRLLNESRRFFVRIGGEDAS